MLLVLRAFASGSTAMTGIEAISNAVPVFKPVEWRNARTTLAWMVGLLIMLFAGTIAMVQLGGIVPNSHETVLSELAHRSFGSGFMYPVTQAATAAVLLLAANTAYNDFPRVLFLLARDYQAPRLFLRMGDRLAFSNGILLLSLAAAVIYLGFGGRTGPLIPLYAVGVFLAFTLSQAGMVVHWWRLRDREMAPEHGLQRNGVPAFGDRVRHGGNHEVHLRRVGLAARGGRFHRARREHPAPLRNGIEGDRAASPRQRGAAKPDPAPPARGGPSALRLRGPMTRRPSPREGVVREERGEPG